MSEAKEPTPPATSQDDSPSTGPPLLFSLDGAAPPAELVSALAAIAKLTPQARESLPELIGHVLPPMAEDQLDNRIVRLASRAKLDPKTLAPPIKATRFLVRAAAAHDASPEDFRQDLQALCPAQAATVELLAPIYQQALPGLRQEILVNALQAHGHVLTGLEWRIDTIGSTSSGRSLNAPVALITLHFQDRQQSGSFTIQALPDGVQQLRTLCDQLLASSPAKPESAAPPTDG